MSNFEVRGRFRIRGKKNIADFDDLRPCIEAGIPGVICHLDSAGQAQELILTLLASPRAAS